MGIKLMVEVLDHAPPSLTTGDRLLLASMAEKANDETRRCYPGWELLAWRMQWADQKDGGKGAVRVSVANLAKRLVAAGYEDIRVPIGEGKDGRKVYATKGHASVYRIPAFTPPLGCRCTSCTQRGAVGASLCEDPGTTEGGQPAPPFELETDSKGGQSAYVKGGSSHTYRGAISIRKGGQPVPPLPSGTLKEPSENPHLPADGSSPTTRTDETGKTNGTQPEPSSSPAESQAPARTAARQPALISKTAIRLPEALQIILDDLRIRGFPEATRTDAEAIRAAVAKQHGSKTGPAYLRGIARNSGFDGWYADLRKQRATQVDAALKHLRATEPPCEHGTEAGRATHPAAGTFLCPECRRGNPRHDDGTPNTHPDDQAVIAAYLQAAPQQPRGIFAATLASQSRQLRMRGASLDQLRRIAVRAAQTNVDLFQALRAAKEESAA